MKPVLSFLLMTTLIFLSGCSQWTQGPLGSEHPVTKDPPLITEANPQASDHPSPPLTPLSEEHIQLRQLYFSLFNDVDNMRFFSDFSTPEEISEGELILFAYLDILHKQPETVKDGIVLLSQINSVVQKYFDRNIAGGQNVPMLNYVAGTQGYVATGWDTSGSQPHYLAAQTENADGSLTATFDVYYIGELQQEISPIDYISTPDLIPSTLVHAWAESTFYLDHAEDGPHLRFISYKRLLDGVDNPNFPVADYFRAVPYNVGDYLADEECVVAGGIRLGMTYDEVLKILGDYDDAYSHGPNVKSVFKNNVQYAFSLNIEATTSESGFSSDNVFRLYNINLGSYTHDEFPRSIHIGDTIDQVLSKLPGEDKTLRKWAYQMIYGQDIPGTPRAQLRFTLFDECYRLYLYTETQLLLVTFNRDHQVSGLELIKESF